MKTHVLLKNLSFSYPDGSPALRDINLSIRDGEKVALIGPNGAGKSTLLLHLNGILRGSGAVEIDGTTLSDRTVREIRRKVGMIFQDPNDQLFCPTVADDVAYGPMHFGLPREDLHEIVHDALKEVGMEHLARRAAHHLSLGERRRVTIAAVLACRPDILAMDEPAATLDPKRRRWLIDFINRSSKTAIIATHDLDLALRTCGRVVLMNAGKIAADGEIGAILADAGLLTANDLEPVTRMD